jgi:undecaprenyl-diphosphatase
MESYLAALVLGVIEGLTEFLPVSSTAHLLIAEHWMGRRSEAFNIVIQLGAVLAVLLVYRRQSLPFFSQRIGAADAAPKKGTDYLGKILLAFGITAFLGLAAKKAGWKLPEELGPVILALFLGAFLIFLAERRFQKQGIHRDVIDWRTAAFVGVAQALAGIFPGLSRSAATILTALCLGVRRVEATEFSFLLGVPTMTAASFYSLVEETHFFHRGLEESWPCLAIGFFVSAIVGFAAVRWLLSYVRSHSFVPFGWYRILLALALLLAVGRSG